MKKLYLLILMILILVACQNSNPDPVDPLFKPENAFGGTLPSDAQMVTPEEFKALSTTEGFTIDTLKIRVDRRAAAVAQFKTDTDEVKLLSANSSAYQRALVEPDPADPSLKILPDGNYLLTIEGKSGPFTVVTDGKPALYRDMLESRKKYFNAANQLKVYTTSYEELPDALKAGLPLPAALWGQVWMRFCKLEPILESIWQTTRKRLVTRNLYSGTGKPGLHQMPNLLIFQARQVSRKAQGKA